MNWLSQNGYWIVLALVMFLMMRRGGMGCGMGTGRHAPREDHSHHDSDGAALRDPVNGHPVDRAHALTTIFDGRTYYFESEASRETFNQDPQRFAGGVHRRHHGC